VLEDRGDTLEWISRLDDRRQVSDLAAALAWLRAQPAVDPGRTAVVGFSIGGRYATLLATEAHGLRAVVTFYTRPWPQGAGFGRVIAPGDHLDRLLAPVCAVFGSDDDLVPPEMVERFDRTVRRRPEAGHQVRVLPGRHYFTDESRPRRFRADSSAEAWSEALAFLARHLGRGVGSGA
jgi:dienelactone hydrolase